MRIARKALIVGYDPGITSAISILDMHGNLVSLTSKRDIGRANLIKLISEFGRPVIISTDKHPLPRSVGKLASKLGIKPFCPEMPLSHTEKGELIRELEVKVKIGMKLTHWPQASMHGRITGNCTSKSNIH